MALPPLLVLRHKPHADDIVPDPAPLAFAHRLPHHVQLEGIGHGLARRKLQARAVRRQVAHPADQHTLAVVEHDLGALEDGLAVLAASRVL